MQRLWDLDDTNERKVRATEKLMLWHIEKICDVNLTPKAHDTFD